MIRNSISINIEHRWEVGSVYRSDNVEIDVSTVLHYRFGCVRCNSAPSLDKVHGTVYGYILYGFFLGDLKGSIHCLSPRAYMNAPALEMRLFYNLPAWLFMYETAAKSGRLTSTKQKTEGKKPLLCSCQRVYECDPTQGRRFPSQWCSARERNCSRHLPSRKSAAQDETVGGKCQFALHRSPCCQDIQGLMIWKG